jgi:RNA polymerase sigma-70 factor (ECF subfamily)
MDDLAAIAKCRGGDKEAFRHLVERYQAEALGHAMTILGNREDALDAAQEAFLDAYRALDQFRSSGKFYPWFYVMLRNRCLKSLAAKQRRPAVSLEGQALLAPAAGGRSSSGTALLEHALREMAAEDREILTLKHLDGLGYRELAERLGIPEGTVMSRLYRARERLRQKAEACRENAESAEAQT